MNYLHGNTDAEDWVNAFFTTVEKNPSVPHSWDAMRGWFANAIESGRAAGLKEAQRAARDALEGPGQARATDGPTARAAAVKTPQRGSQRWAVLEALAKREMTAFELVETTGIIYRSLTPRIGELKHGDYIEETGETRKTDTDSDAVVLRLTDKGRGVLGLGEAAVRAVTERPLGSLLDRFHPRKCGSCGATIVFLKTTKAKAMPLDPEPVEGGNVRVRDGIALVNSEPDLLDDGFRYQSHFASCPNADRHRRTDAA